MKKSSDLDVYLFLFLVVLFIISIIISKTGWFLFALSILLIVWACFNHLNKEAIRNTTDLQNIIVDTIENKIHPSNYKSISKSLMYTEFGELARFVQIARDSIDICLTSRKADTAKSRYDLLNSTWDEVTSRWHILDEVYRDRCKAVYDQTITEYHTISYINQAVAYIEKSKTLKTEKSKAKYIDLAKQVINDGINDPLSDKYRLDQTLKQIL